MYYFSFNFDNFRFTQENSTNRPQLCFLPFGVGPRSCIGMRFALMEAKMALIELMKKVSFLRSADTEVMWKYVLNRNYVNSLFSIVRFH